MLDSLVRVSRQVEWDHYVTKDMSGRCHATPAQDNDLSTRPQTVKTTENKEDLYVLLSRPIRGYDAGGANLQYTTIQYYTNTIQYNKYF